ncbi:hypothetical protein pEaSNUABM19_00450 [Erwinia phage pEa_SNUABM_19]|uniref:Uncharacterized protein n=1 Tax=Erwinia phage pEa_SNUABM_12 TaxID=2768773 RepID=A0A7L8ZM19_9CAUD|nr:hypothetical protein pEaSNUABM12_00450 [Erwinia phage pEa_SNUABM_12]QXO11585.1 hypothetical protein pEaSNUABM19_00450 [Erwinia phage pEa_SNUABM_19]
MSVKFTPVVTTLKNTLVVELEYEHGDADATTFEYVNIPVLPEQKESIGVLLSMIEHGLECQNSERYDEDSDPVFEDDTVSLLVMDGGEISFTYNGINVNIGNVGDCTVDGQFNASGGINAVYYYDENAIKYSVTEY